MNTETKFFTVDLSFPVSLEVLKQIPENKEGLTNDDWDKIESLEVGETVEIGFGEVEIKRIK